MTEQGHCCIKAVPGILDSLPVAKGMESEACFMQMEANFWGHGKTICHMGLVRKYFPMEVLSEEHGTREGSCPEIKRL